MRNFTVEGESLSEFCKSYTSRWVFAERDTPKQTEHFNHWGIKFIYLAQFALLSMECISQKKKKKVIG